MGEGIGDRTSPRLGSPIQDYRVALTTRIGAGVVTVVAGGFALLFAFVLVFSVQHSPNEVGMAVLFDLVFALPTGLIGLFLFWRFIELCMLRATVYTDGVRFRTVRRERSASWEDVSSIVIDAPRPPNLLLLLVLLVFCWFLAIPYVLSQLFPRRKYSLCLKGGGRMRIPPALAAKTSLVETVEIAIARDQLAEMLVRFQNGTPSHFGTFSVEVGGLHARKAILPWREVHLVTRTASGISVFRRGEQSPWYTARLKDVPNPALFQILVARICEHRGY